MAVENLSIAISLLGNLLKLFHFINAVLLIAKSNFAMNEKNPALTDEEESSTVEVEHISMKQLSLNNVATQRKFPPVTGCSFLFPPWSSS